MVALDRQAAWSRGNIMDGMMKVSDIMTERPASVRLHSTLREVLVLMEQLGCHHMPVLNTENRLVGIISDRDCRLAMNSPYITRKYWQNDELLNSLSARMIMISSPLVITPDADAVEAAKVMLTERIGCLPVMYDDSLVGIITRSDILMTFINPPD
jgi:acetoin utilization protein AcuB